MGAKADGCIVQGQGGSILSRQKEAEPLDSKGPVQGRDSTAQYPVEVKRRYVSVDAFITGRRNRVDVLHRGRQLILRKIPLELPAFCWNRDPCLRIGRYLYAWQSDRLLEVGTDREIPLSKREGLVLQEILRASK